MNRKEMTALLRKQNILNQLRDGPTSMMVRKNGKMVLATVTRKGEWVIVTTGRFFRRRMRVPLAQLEE